MLGAALQITALALAVEPSAVLLPTDADAEFRVGVPVELTLEVTRPPGDAAVVAADLPWPEAWGERSRRRLPPRASPDGAANGAAKEGATVERFVFEMIPFEPGRYSLGPFEVELGDRTLKTAPLRVTVRSNLPPEVQAALTASAALPPGQLESLAAPDPDALRIYRTNWLLIGGVAGGLLALIVAALVIRRWRRGPGAAPAPPPVPRRPADEIALEALRKLAGETPSDHGGINAYYTLLSRIFRAYLGRHFHFDASELTHEELEDALVRLRLPERDRTDVLQMLELADYVKFARFEPSDEQARAEVERAVELVERTRKQAGRIGAGRDFEVPASFPEHAEARAEETSP